MDKFVNLAKKLLGNNGFLISIKKRTKGSFNIEEGEYETIEETIEGKAVFLTLKTEELLLKSSGLTDFLLNKVDSVILCSTESYGWETDAKVEIDGVGYEILGFSDIKSGLNTACRKVILSRV